MTGRNRRIPMVKSLERKLKTTLSINIITKNLRLVKVSSFFILDEIPFVLLELNESALAYITRE